MQSEGARNFFQLFGLPARFELDVDDLSARYRDLQRRFHPDRYASRPTQERRLALQMTAEINDAYRTLRNPVTRGRYLLGLRGVDTGEQGDTAMDPAFLVEQMELREAVAEARQGSQASTRLQQLGEQVQRDIDARTRRLGECLDCGGESSDARSLVRELQFLDKIRTELADMIPLA